MGIYELIKGEVRAQISGAYPQSILNAAMQHGIEIRKTEYIDAAAIRLSFYERDMEAMRQLARQCMCELEIIGLRGGSRTRGLIKRRWGLAALAIILMSGIVLSSLFVWDIDVRGNESVSRAEILRALSEAGLDYGSFWYALKMDVVRSETMARLPEIGWMAVNVSGSRATILVRERREKPEIYSEADARDIIAGKTGIIKSISVLNGMARVSAGDAVTEGETLISGTMDSITNGSRYVAAKGRITADTWYEMTAAAPREELLKTAHKGSLRRFALKIGKMRINLYPSSGKPIDECDKIITEYKLGKEGLFCIPITLVEERLRYYDSSPGSALDTQELREELTERLRQQVCGQINSISFSEGEANGVYTVTLRAACTEDIGEYSKRMYGT